MWGGGGETKNDEFSDAMTGRKRMKKREGNPKMTAFHTMISSSQGAPLTPAGGSSWTLERGRTIREVVRKNTSPIC